MIKYFKNGVLQAETLDVPQDCGKIRVTINLEEELEGVNYFLEFSCPRNVKYISQKLVRIAEKEYEVILPRGITEYTGEVYVQMVIMSIKDEELLSRSLIARDPLFVIKESILASVALDNEGKQDFFDYALNVVGKAENVIDELKSNINAVPDMLDNKVAEALNVVDSTLSEHNEKITDLESNTLKVENVKNEFDSVTDGLYSATYINNNFGKGIYKESGTSQYITGSGLAKVGSLTMPVSGKLIVTVSTYYSMVQVRKFAIRSKKVDYKNFAVTDAQMNDRLSVTLCCEVTAGDIYDIYAEAMASDEENIYDYDFVILEG